MDIKVSVRRKWVPKWNNNEEDDHPITFIHRAPTMALKEELLPKPRIKFKIGAKGAEGGETEMEVNAVQIVKRMTLEIENLALTLKDDETGKEKKVLIKSADDLYGDDTPSELSGLADEAGQYYQKLLQQAVPAKN